MSDTPVLIQHPSESEISYISTRFVVELEERIANLDKVEVCDRLIAHVRSEAWNQHAWKHSNSPCGTQFCIAGFFAEMIMGMSIDYTGYVVIDSGKRYSPGIHAASMLDAGIGNWEVADYDITNATIHDGTHDPDKMVATLTYIRNYWAQEELQSE